MRSSIVHGWVAAGLFCVANLYPACAEEPASALRTLVSSRPSSAPELETRVPIADSLKQLYQRGGVPRNLDQLVAMERQAQAVAKRVSDCTVNVSIGPAQGCGVIIDETGYIFTAAHVGMRPGKTATISFSNGRTVFATTLGMNRSVDAGLLKINDGQNQGQPWPHATLGNSETLLPGMWCIASGHPGGFDQERGPVTRVGRILKVRDDSVVTDCALIGGDSGGPLFDLEGRLIAVHSRIGNDVADNLHIPIEHYDQTWDRLAAGKAWGYLPGFKPVLGVQGNPESTEARLELVKMGSPAEQAGLQQGDVILKFGETPINDFSSLVAAVADTMPGERIVCLVLRNGEHIRVNVEIGRDDRS